MGVQDLRWMLPVRPGDIVRLEGEIVDLKPSTTSRMVALVKWVLYNQNGEAVYTFTPIAIVPVGRSSDPLAMCNLYLDGSELERT